MWGHLSTVLGGDRARLSPFYLKYICDMLDTGKVTKSYALLICDCCKDGLIVKLQRFTYPYESRVLFLVLSFVAFLNHFTVFKKYHGL